MSPRVAMNSPANHFTTESQRHRENLLWIFLDFVFLCDAVSLW
jgi:hypothetical protein